MIANKDFQSAKQELIESFGTLGSNWGINKAMAKIHILLLISPKPLSAEEIMEELSISRGNANTNIRGLIEWGLIKKKLVPGERKEFFYSIKDLWEMLRIIVTERKKREIQPAVESLKNAIKIKKNNSDEINEFLKITNGLLELVDQMNFCVNSLMKIEKNKFLRNLFLK